MTSALVVGAVLVPLALVAVAVGHWSRARRARRQLLDALAAVPELADVAPPGFAEQAASLAAAVAFEARHIFLSYFDACQMRDTPHGFLIDRHAFSSFQGTGALNNTGLSAEQRALLTPFGVEIFVL
jgi:hypothetical protein